VCLCHFSLLACVGWKSYPASVKRPLIPYISSSLSPHVPTPALRSPYLLPLSPSPAWRPPLPPSPLPLDPSPELIVELLAEYKGQKFNYNDLVDVIMGTGPGVVGKKCEPIKARFKGVVETVRGPEFLCRSLVGSSRGPCPQYPRHSVFRMKAFGSCVLGTKEPRFFSKLKPAMQER
jgi:hypothetical protein